MTTILHDIPPEVRQAYGLENISVSLIRGGNINLTFKVTGKVPVCVQRVNPIFGPKVQEDILAVTQHLKSQGMLTPQLRPTMDGQWWTTDHEGNVWRLMDWIEGTTHKSQATPTLCGSAGALLGKFHVALQSFQHVFQNERPFVHNTARHMRYLQEVLSTHHHHMAFERIAPLGEAILKHHQHLPELPLEPNSVVHGDPKLDNFIFSPDHHALCLIDLDTLSRMPLWAELGDAFRSWCNIGGENAVPAVWDQACFEAGITGYVQAAKAYISRNTLFMLPVAVETIALELSARFCADALAEKYFGWDETHFASASAHHEQRARGQLSLAEILKSQRQALLTTTDKILNTLQGHS